MNYSFTLLLITFCFFTVTDSFCQVNIYGSYSGTKVTAASGFGASVGYEIPLKNNRFGLIPQVSYKCNCGYNFLTESDVENRLSEFHLTMFYQLVDNPKYKLIPNLGFNIRHSLWSAQMRSPLNTFPIRFYGTFIRDKEFVVQSVTNQDYSEVKFITPGYTIQMINRFEISDKISLDLTPFFETDYDMNQDTGGLYLGVNLTK